MTERVVYRAILLFPLLLGLWVPAVEAQTRVRLAAPDNEPSGSQIGVSLGPDTLFSPPPLPEGDLSYAPAPLVSGTSWQDRLMLGSIGGIEAEILRGSNFAAGLSARSERPGYRLKTGRDESTLEFGAFGEIFFDDWSIIGRVGQDVSQEGGGFVADLGVTWASQVAEGWRLQVGSGVSWASSGYIDRFFGVGGREAHGSGLRLYDPSPGLKDISISGSVTYSLTDSWTIGGMVGAQRLIGPVAASPLVKDENEFFGGLSLDYRF